GKIMALKTAFFYRVAIIKITLTIELLNIKFLK
ncbi:MAG: hypothetical protein ACI9VT_001757, partial [Psychroserpens sp.]